jgi:hypothetical protein
LQFETANHFLIFSDDGIISQTDPQSLEMLAAASNQHTQHYLDLLFGLAEDNEILRFALKFEDLIVFPVLSRVIPFNRNSRNPISECTRSQVWSPFSDAQIVTQKSIVRIRFSEATNFLSALGWAKFRQMLGISRLPLPTTPIQNIP